MMNRNQCLKILNLGPNATPQDIAAQYRRLVKTYHPDRYYQDKPRQLIAEKRLKDITQAYAFLKQLPYSKPEQPTNNTEKKESIRKKANFFQRVITFLKKHPPTPPKPQKSQPFKAQKTKKSVLKKNPPPQFEDILRQKGISISKSKTQRTSGINKARSEWFQKRHLYGNRQNDNANDGPGPVSPVSRVRPVNGRKV